MICDNCTKAKVCRYKENCNILERDVAGSKIENIITLEVRCNQKETMGINIRTNAQVQAHNAMTSEARGIAKILGL